MDMGSVFDDLEALKMPADMLPKEARVISRPKHRTKKHEVEEFWHVPKPSWRRPAIRAVRTRQQVECAMEIYRLWRMRPEGAKTVTVSNKICDNFITRGVKRRTLNLLKTAGLIEIISCSNGAAPVIRVVEKEGSR
jgi:hypothetical protein